MELKFNINHPREKVLDGLSKMLDDNKVAKLGELKTDNDGFMFRFSQFGVTTVTLKVRELEVNEAEVAINFDIAATHKIILTDSTINKNVEKYREVLLSKYLA